MKNKNSKNDFKMTEIGLLPENWCSINFEDCILKERINVSKIKRRDYEKMGKYPIIDQGKNLIAGYCNSEDDAYKDKLPIIIFGDHTRIFKYIDFPFVCGADGTKVILPDDSKVKPAFFYYALSNLKIESRGYNRHYHLLKEKSIPLPPLSEQKKIAAVLSAVQEDREKTEAVIVAAKELKKSLMKYLFTYGPVPVDQADKVKLKETEIGLVPDEWEISKLKDISNLITKGSSPKWQGYEYIKTGITFIRSQNIGFCKLLLNDLVYLPEAFNKKEKRSIIKENDLLINIVGASIGRAAVANKKISGGNLNQAVAIARLDKKNKKFFMYYLLSESGLQQLHKQKKEIARANLSLQDISNFQVPLPAEEIQRKIEEILNLIDNNFESEQSKKQALDQLFKTLLNNLMTGKIRVNHLEIGDE